MNKYIILILLFSGVNTWAVKKDTKSCQQVEAQIKENVKKLNAMFKMDVTVTFIETLSFGDVTWKARIIDSNAGHRDTNGKETLEFPKPCNLDEELPVKEFWHMIVAHEFSHKILDKEINRCSSISDETHGDLAFDQSAQMYNLNHLNVYLMSLKILKFWKVDSIKASEEFEKWMKTVPDAIGDDSLKALKGIAIFLKARAKTTSFNSGNDFITGAYFDRNGLNILNQFLKRNYPNSTLIKDIENKVHKEVGPCMMFKTEDVAHALAAWKKLTRIP